jgi:hypothetical protein
MAERDARTKQSAGDAQNAAISFECARLNLKSEVCSAWFCTQHLPFCVLAPAGLCLAPFFQSFKACFKLPHATY